MGRKRTVAAVLGLAAITVAGAGAWFLRDSDRSAARIAFHNDGTGLEATDVQAALQELTSRMRAVESGQSSLHTAAAVQEQRLSSVQTSSSEQQVRMQGQEERLGALEERVAEATGARRRIDYTDGAASTAIGPAYVPLRDLGTFVKRHAASTVTLTWNTHLDALGDSGSFCDVQIRVDGKPDSELEGGGGRAVAYVPAGQQGTRTAVSVSTLFARLGPGAHTVSVWVRGSALECIENYGNFPRSVLVEEGPRAP